MNTLSFYAAIAKHLASIESNLNALADIYENIEARTTLDEDLIDLLNLKADEVKTAATALKSITYSGG